MNTIEDYDLNFTYENVYGDVDDEQAYMHFIESGESANLMEIDIEGFMEQLAEGTITVNDYMDMMHQASYPNLVFEKEYVIEDIVRPLSQQALTQCTAPNDLPFVKMNTHVMEYNTSAGTVSKFTPVERRVYGEDCDLLVNQGEIRNYMQRKQAILSMPSASCFEKNVDLIPSLSPVRSALESLGRVSARGKLLGLPNDDLTLFFKRAWNLPDEYELDIGLFEPVFKGQAIPRLRALQSQRYLTVFDSEEYSQVCDFSTGRGMSRGPNYSINWGLIYQILVLLAKREISWNPGLKKVLQSSPNGHVFYMAYNTRFMTDQYMTLDTYGFGVDFSNLDIIMPKKPHLTSLKSVMHVIDDIQEQKERNNLLYIKAKNLMFQLEQSITDVNELNYAIKGTTTRILKEKKNDIMSDKQRICRTTRLMLNFPPTIGGNLWMYVVYMMRQHAIQVRDSPVLTASSLASQNRRQTYDFIWKSHLNEFLLLLAKKSLLKDSLTCMRRLNPNMTDEHIFSSLTKYVDSHSNIYPELLKVVNSETLCKWMSKVHYSDLNYAGRSQLILHFEKSISWINSRVVKQNYVHVNESKSFYQDQSKILLEALQFNTEKWLNIYTAAFAQYKIEKQKHETMYKLYLQSLEHQMQTQIHNKRIIQEQMKRKFYCENVGNTEMIKLAKYRKRQVRATFYRNLNWIVKLDETTHIIQPKVNYNNIAKGYLKKLLKYMVLSVVKQEKLNKQQQDLAMSKYLVMREISAFSVLGHDFSYPLHTIQQRYHLVVLPEPEYNEYGCLEVIDLCELCDYYEVVPQFRTYQYDFTQSHHLVCQTMSDILDGHIRNVEKIESKHTQNYKTLLDQTYNLVRPNIVSQNIILEIQPEQDDYDFDMMDMMLAPPAVIQKVKVTLHQALLDMGLDPKPNHYKMIGKDPMYMDYDYEFLEICETIIGMDQKQVISENVFKDL